MNWTQFLLGLTGIYLLYYALNVSLDFLKSGSSKTNKKESDVLFFSEDMIPKLIVHEEEAINDPVNVDELTMETPAFSSGVLESTGGGTLKDMFSLAQTGKIVYTKGISY